MEVKVTFGGTIPVSCWGNKGNFKEGEKEQWDNEEIWVVTAKLFLVKNR